MTAGRAALGQKALCHHLGRGSVQSCGCLGEDLGPVCRRERRMELAPNLDIPGDLFTAAAWGSVLTRAACSSASFILVLHNQL